MHPLRLVGAAASLIVLAAGLSACQDPNDPSPENTPALAGPPVKKGPVGHAVRDRSLRMTRGQVLHALAAGPAKQKWAHLDMSIKSPSFTITGTGDMVYSRTRPAIRLEMAGSCLCVSDTEVVVKNHVYYFNIPSLTGDRYASLDPKSPSSPLGRDFGKISDELDSLSVLLDMRPAFGKVRASGRRELYGHPMSTYTLVVDGKRGIAARGLPSLMGEAPRRYVYHLWFDPNRLLRKMTWSVGKIHLSSEMSDWGKRVRVKAPGRSQLVAPGVVPGSRSA
jgi:hypothetical protein